MTDRVLHSLNVQSRGSLSEIQSIAVWLILTTATCLSWWLGSDHGFGNQHRVSSSLILLIAFIKIRLIGLYFMELRHGPMVLRRLFDGFCLVACAALVAMYLAA